MEVVLPTPLTPMTRMTAGLPETSSGWLSSILSVSTSRSRSRSSEAVVVLRSFARFSTSATIFAEVAAPTSERMSASSSSSRRSASILTNAANTLSSEWLTASEVFLKPCLILSKIPCSAPVSIRLFLPVCVTDRSNSRASFPSPCGRCARPRGHSRVRVPSAGIPPDDAPRSRAS